MVNIRSDRFPPSEALSAFRVALRGCLTEQTIGIRGKRDRRIRVTAVLCIVVYRLFSAMRISQMAWNYSSRHHSRARCVLDSLTGWREAIHVAYI